MKFLSYFSTGRSQTEPPLLKNETKSLPWFLGELYTGAWTVCRNLIVFGALKKYNIIIPSKIIKSPLIDHLWLACNILIMNCGFLKWYLWTFSLIYEGLSKILLFGKTASQPPFRMFLLTEMLNGMNNNMSGTIKDKKKNLKSLLVFVIMPLINLQYWKE